MAIFVPATIKELMVFDPHEVTSVRLEVPMYAEINGTTYPVFDNMRPGTAFLAQPFGTRSGRWENRLYTRSNCSSLESRILETIINDTKEIVNERVGSNTSRWWQGLDVRVGDKINIGVYFNPDRTELYVYENKIVDPARSLKLESNAEWKDKKILGIGFATGVTPLFAHARYMASLNFLRCSEEKGAHYFLIVNVKRPSQLLFHGEFLEMAKKFPDNFNYHAVLTREWSDEWSGTRGRIIKREQGTNVVSLGPLLKVVPDIRERHIMLCGGEEPLEELKLGLKQAGIEPKSLRAETW